MEQQPPEQAPAAEQRDHGGDIALSTIMMAGIGGTAILVVVILMVRGLFVTALQQERFNKVIQQQPVELMQLREQELSRINSYNWIDRERGVISIPIEQAMMLTAAHLETTQLQPASQPATPAVADVAVEPGAEITVTPAEATEAASPAQSADNAPVGSSNG